MNEASGLVARDTGLPVARELAEMLLTQIDIANSLASLRVWVEGYVADGQEDQRTKAIRGSLFRDAITQFVCCFDSKNAYPLVVEEVFPNVEGIAPYFRWLRDLRNSYTAHRHGAARQCAVGVFVNPVSGEYLGVGRLFAIYAGPSKDGHTALLSLVEMAARYVEARINLLQTQFETESRGLTPNHLLTLPPLALQPQSSTTMGKSRGDVRKGIAREHDDQT